MPVKATTRATLRPNRTRTPSLSAIPGAAATERLC